MCSDDYTKHLEEVIKQFLKPIKNVPFKLVIESITGYKVLPIDTSNLEHKEVIELLKTAAINAAKRINNNGIIRARPNEVGNDIEKFIKEELNQFSLKADTPMTSKGSKKSSGYPDLIFWYKDKPYYLECKTFNLNNIATTQRTFYFSPSSNFKVIYNAPHLILSYQTYIAGSINNKHIFKCSHYKIISLESLLLDIKYEFNSDNKRLYSDVDGAKILAQGEIK